MLSRLYFKPFKNHKKSKIADYVGFHIENLQSVKYQSRIDIFSPQNSSVIYNYTCILMLSRLFSNHFKIIKNQRSQIVLNFILKILESAKKSKRIDIFSPQNSSVIYNNVFLCYLDCFQII